MHSYMLLVLRDFAEATWRFLIPAYLELKNRVKSEGLL